MHFSQKLQEKQIRFVVENSDNLIITSTDRLKRELDLLMLNNLKSTKKTNSINNNIVSLNFFTKNLFTTYQSLYANNYIENTKFLFEEHQIIFLWQEIISNFNNKNLDDLTLIIQKSKYANLAFTAKKRLDEKFIDEKVLSQYISSYTSSGQHQNFYKWLLEYKKKQNQFNFIGMSEIIYFLNKHKLYDVLLNSLNKKKKIVFYGFDELPYNIKTFCDNSKVNYEISPFLNTKIAKIENENCFSYQNDNLEILEVAKKVVDYNSLNKNHKIGVLSLDLNNNFEEITDIFSEKLNGKKFRISKSLSLFNYNIIQDITSLLKLNFSNKFRDFENVLLSPYFKFCNSCDNYQYIMHKFIQRIKEQCFKNSNLNNILTSINNLDNPYFIEIVEKLSILNNIIQDRKSYSFLEIVNKVHFILDVFGFTKNNLSSKNFQIVNAFYNKALNKIYSYDFISRNSLINYKFAIYKLEEILKKIPFQEETEEDYKINILGILECCEIYFDKIFILNANNNCWPKFPEPTSLLPISLQEKYKMPQYDKFREFEYSEKIVQRLLLQSENFVLSYANFNKNMEQSYSPLFKVLRNAKLFKEDNTEVINYIELENDKKNIDSKLIEKIEGFTKSIKNKLEDIAKCPLKAQLKHNLKINELKENKTSLNFIDRGLSIHNFFEMFFSNIKTKSNLESLLKDKTQAKKVILNILQKINFKVEFSFLVKIELERLSNIIFKNLENQLKKYKYNWEIYSVEEKSNINFGNISSSLKIDRIDKVDDTFNIIDYKTSSICLKNAQNYSRILDAQLYLYLISQKNLNVKSLSYLTTKGDNILKEMKDFDIDSIEEKFISYINEYNLGEIFIIKEHLAINDEKKKTNNGAHCTYCNFSNICLKNVY